MRYLSLLAAVVMVLTLCGLATAATFVGGPFEADSWRADWQQGTNEYTPNGPFDLIQVMMTSEGDSFESATFNITGWSYTLYEGGKYMVMQGPAVNHPGTLYFNMYYAGASSDPLAYKLQVYSDSVLQQNQDFSWNGSGWSYASSGGTWDQQTPYTPLLGGAAVPEPLTMASAFFAIAGLGGYIRRRTGRAAA